MKQKGPKIEINYCIKYMDKKYIKDFLENGTIHFSSLGYFIDKENETGDQVIGDINEGVIVEYLDKNKGQFHIKYKGKMSQIKPVKDVQLKYKDKQINKWGMWCSTLLEISDKNDIELHVEMEKGPFSFVKRCKFLIVIGPSPIRELNNSLGGKDRQMVILTSEFSRRLYKYMYSKNMNFHEQGIQYFDYKKESNVKMDATYKEKTKAAVFTKDKKYAYQREDRLLLPYDFNSELKGGNIHIGNVADCVNVVPQGFEKLNCFSSGTDEYNYLNLYSNSKDFFENINRIRKSQLKFMDIW